MRKLFFTLCLSLFSTILLAQTAEKPINIGIFGSSIQYNGDLGSGLFKFGTFYGQAGLSFSTYLSKHFDFSLQSSWGNTGFTKNNNESFHAQFWTVAALIKYKLFADDDKKWLPYAIGGVGYMRFAEKYSLPYVIETMQLPQLGIGISYKLTPDLNVYFQEGFIYDDHDNVDRVSYRYMDMYLTHTLGISMNLGSVKDEDGDGVADKKDRCPHTPKGVKVDALGCPLDTDGDGVPDYLDKCPNTPKGVKVDANGCPLDTDGDGVPDYLDKCPDTPKGVSVDSNGCPIDTDGDGVPDYLDKCPTIKGIPENKGCPEVKVEEKKVFNEALKGIQFETGSDVILPASFGILDNVVKILENNPHYNLMINGHTDNVGTPENNRILSQKRADAVKNYFIGKGIATKRLNTKGYGETKPIADNSTDEGKALNRRVEFIVEF